MLASKYKKEIRTCLNKKALSNADNGNNFKCFKIKGMNFEQFFKGSKIQRKEISIVLKLKKKKWILNAFKYRKTNL